MVDDKYKELTDLFIANFKSFQSIEEPGGSDAANAIVAAGLAKSIIDALPSSQLNVVGEKTVAEINVYEKVAGDLFTVTDSGVLAGSESLIVNRGWLVWWDGQKFVKVYEGGLSVTVDQALDITSANPIANAPVAAAIVDVNRRIDEIEPGENVQSDWEQDDSTAPDYIKNKPEIPAAITVDSTLSPSSTNPVQNKAVKTALDSKVNTSDIIDITHGGTGATTADNARTSLGLGTLATKDKVSDSDINDAISDSHIASASTWNGKQDAVADLSTIRSNASHGQTAYGWGNHASQGYLKSADIGGKADKVSGATNGNLAALDASGNIKDSGKSVNSFVSTVVIPDRAFAAGSEKWVGLGCFPISSTWKSVTLIVNRDYYGIQKHSSDIFGVAFDNSAGNRYIIRRVAVHNGGNQSAYRWKTKVVGNNVWLLCQDDYGQRHSRFEVTIIGASESFVVSPDYTVTTDGAVDVAIGGHVAEAEKATADGNGDEISTTYAKKTTTVNGHALSSNVTLTKSDVGLGNVGNYKAVSTAASQGLTSTEKSNARDNIGAGTYTLPSTGMPKSSLASSVQTSLGKADTALQQHQDISGKMNAAQDLSIPQGVGISRFFLLSKWEGLDNVNPHFARLENNRFTLCDTVLRLTYDNDTGRLKLSYSDQYLTFQALDLYWSNGLTLVLQINDYANVGCVYYLSYVYLAGKTVFTSVIGDKIRYIEFREENMGGGTYYCKSDAGVQERSVVINDGVLTLKRGGTTIGTFSANQSSSNDIDVTAVADSAGYVNGASANTWYKVLEISASRANNYSLINAKISVIVGETTQWGTSSSQTSVFAEYDIMLRRNGSNTHPSNANPWNILVKKNHLYGMETIAGVRAGVFTKIVNNVMVAEIWIYSGGNSGTSITARVDNYSDEYFENLPITFFKNSAGQSSAPSNMREATRKVIAATSA